MVDGQKTEDWNGEYDDVLDEAFYQRAAKVATRAEFIEIVETLGHAYRKHPDHWENDRLDLYLSAMARFTGAIDGYYKNWRIDKDPEQPTWGMLTDILLAAVVYE